MRYPILLCFVFSIPGCCKATPPEVRIVKVEVPTALPCDNEVASHHYRPGRDEEIPASCKTAACKCDPCKCKVCKCEAKAEAPKAEELPAPCKNAACKCDPCHCGNCGCGRKAEPCQLPTSLKPNTPPARGPSTCPRCNRPAVVAVSPDGKERVHVCIECPAAIVRPPPPPITSVRDSLWRIEGEEPAPLPFLHPEPEETCIRRGAVRGWFRQRFGRCR